EHRPSTPNQRPSSARHRTNPSSSTLPPSSPHVDETMMSPNSTTISSSSSSSKVTLTDVYETLRKLEEVEQFPIQTMIENDSGMNIR
ncbi:unnamed protein product, partial [Rotaria magnacalcarata]